MSDVVYQTLDAGVTEIRMSDPVLEALLELRGFLFEAVYENQTATAEFGSAPFRVTAKRVSMIPMRGKRRMLGQHGQT